MKTLTLISALIILLARACCPTPYHDERFYIQNDSDYPVVIKSWDQGSIIFEATLNHGDSVGVAAYDFSSIWLDDLLIISYSNVDSNVVVFDQVKRWNNEVVGQATLYKATNCEKDRKQISCDRTFHITNSHYAQADSI